MTNIAMEKTYKWRFLAGKIIYKWAIFTNQLTNLWLFNIAMEMAHRNRWFSQRTKPPFMVGIFHGYVSHNQMVYTNIRWDALKTGILFIHTYTI